MSAPSHTPGPLYAEQTGRFVWTVRDEETGAALAVCFDSDEHANPEHRTNLPAEANACLYAASPDLLKAVECFDALAWRLGEPADKRAERIGETFSRAGWCSDGDAWSDDQLQAWAEDLASKTLRSLRGESAVVGGA